MAHFASPPGHDVLKSIPEVKIKVNKLKYKLIGPILTKMDEYAETCCKSTAPNNLSHSLKHSCRLPLLEK